MSGKQANEPPLSDAVRIYQITERHRTYRAFGLYGLLFLLSLVVGGVIIWISYEPWWKVLAGTLGATIGTVFGGQYGIFHYLSARFKRYTIKHHDRTTEMEKKLDPNRTSSGLMKDGSSPPEDMT